MAHTFPVEQSILSPPALLHVAGGFEIAPPSRCDFLRRGLNDTYLVHSGAERSILRVYRAGRRTPEEIGYEIDLLLHLVESGVRVPRPIPLRHGRFLRELEAPEGRRPVALFTYLPGSPPTGTDALFMEHYAAAIGEFHAAADGFVSPHPRPALHLHFLLDEPLAAIRTYLEDQPQELACEDLAYLERLAAKLRARIEPLLPALDWGPVHGDASLTNIHVADDGGVSLFDFDNAGPGPRANDTAAFWGNAQEDGAGWIWDAFRRGYERAHRLDEANIAVLPAIHAARLFMSLGFHAANPIYWGVARQREIVDAEIALLRRWDEKHLDR